MSNATITFGACSLSLNGLQLSYTKDGAKFLIKYDPFATCDLLQQAGLIEGFEQDGHEPVILFTHEYEAAGYGFAYWCQFVKTFPMCKEVAQLLIEFKEGRKVYNRAIAAINYLLFSVKATA